MTPAEKARCIQWAGYYGAAASVAAKSGLPMLLEEARTNAMYAAQAAFSAHPELREEKK